MGQFTLDLLNFMMFPFRSVSPLIIIPAAMLAVSGAFQLFRRMLSRT